MEPCSRRIRALAAALDAVGEVAMAAHVRQVALDLDGEASSR